jgi:hypothetical protein
MKIIYGNILPAPLWKNFTFFQEIVPGNINRVGEARSSSSTYQKLQRKVLFYGDSKKLMATVFLIGNEFKNTDESKPTFWRVVDVHLLEKYDESRIFDKSNWMTFAISEEMSPFS